METCRAPIFTLQAELLSGWPPVCALLTSLCKKDKCDMDTCRAPTPQLNIEGLQEQDPTPAQQRPRLPPRKRCKLDVVKGASLVPTAG